MAKTLLFNGCSYTAGDAVVWHEYNKEHNWEYVVNNNIDDGGMLTPNQKKEMLTDYSRNYRPTRNLAAQCANLLETNKVDLSIDGNSNQAIVYQTISYLENCTAEEHQNIHVCIGWSEFARRIKWLDDKKVLTNLHCSYNFEQDLEQYINHAIIMSDMTDHCLDYIKQILTLQNYLESKNITYTFWRTLGYFRIQKTDQAFDNIKDNNFFKLPVDRISDVKNWISFDDQSIAPWLGDPWMIQFQNNDFIHRNNLHPKLSRVINLAEQIAKHISST